MRAPLLLAFAVACASPRPRIVAPATPAGAIDARVAKLAPIDGLFPLYWDAAHGALLMKITHYDEFLYLTGLSSGVGSNPLGLDRDQVGGSHLVHFERVGGKVLLVESNPSYRALSENAAERRAVEDSFARSVLWGFKAEAIQGDAVLIDATDFFLSDMHGIAKQLADQKEGTYAVDAKRSAIALTKAFPNNDEIDALLTFEGHDGGPHLSSVVPWTPALTVREHHSLVALPGPGYQPRAADPRVGTFTLDFFDYASPFTEPVDKHWVVRHRLVAGQPLVYYVDPGAPAPIRAALIEGASWWSEAFSQVGAKFEVRELPAGVDPMDVRYNMIHWVHRAERGWSYGAPISDPRTGEIIRGNVVLGSLRIRHDVDIARGLSTNADQIAQLALARIRQLAAHEVGHTLGLAHNFVAGRDSVMDYPAPHVDIANGKLDLSHAYAAGIGAYDKAAIAFLYGDGKPAGQPYVTDGESRSVGGAHPLASTWDEAGDPVKLLAHELEVRKLALAQFGADNLAGAPPAQLEEILVPLALHHRYQLEAAAKSIGGAMYAYDGTPARAIVPAKQQREALALVLSTLEPAQLEIPQRIVELIPPRGDVAITTNTELFDRKTAPLFDPTTAALASAEIAIEALLEPHRAARLERFHAEAAANPGFTDVLDALLPMITRTLPGTRGELVRGTARLVATRLMDLASGIDTDGGVRAESAEALRALSAKLAGGGATAAERAHRNALRDDIDKFLARPDAPRVHAKPAAVPPGAPL